MGHEKKIKNSEIIAPNGDLVANFRPKNGVNLRIGLWKNEKINSKSTVILLPGATEFIEKYYEVIDELLSRQYAVAILDWRGQGLSDRLLANPHKHYIDHFESYISDLKYFVNFLGDEKLPKPFNILAHSMGGHIGLRYLREHPDTIEKAVFSAPMVGIRFGFLPEIVARGMISRAVRRGRSEQYAPGQGDYGPRKRGKGAMRLLTHDPVRFMVQHNAIDQNPKLALGGQTIGWLDAALKSIKILNSVNYPEGIKTPVCIIQAGKDLIVKNKAQNKIAKRIPNCRLERIPQSAHEILMEVDEVRDQFWSYFDDFMG